MKGDFSRLTFDPTKHFSGVLMQQGRVQLDADWNEQGSILRHALRVLAKDLIGPFGAPANADGTPGDGFRLALRRNPDGTPTKNDFAVRPGRYYVDGIAFENPAEWVYSQSLDAPPPGSLEAGVPYLLYLDVWERHVIYLEDEILREVALLGADTATRSQVVWRIRADKGPKDPIGPKDPKALTTETVCQSLRREWSRWVERWQPAERGRLKARARPGMPDDTDPCLASPEARYRGENQLYRVEIHQGGTAGHATFKWSSDNGSIVFPILTPVQGTGTTTVTLENLGRDDRSGLVQGDWVEIADGEEDLRDGSDPLLKVDKVDPDTLEVTLKGQPPAKIGQPPSKALLLRRWDHRRSVSKTPPTAAGVFTVQEDSWLDLEDGVQVLFAPAGGSAQQVYRPGDYWLIPARVATGDVEWPGPADAPLALPPHGIEHHYAPLGLVNLGDPVQIKDCRTTFGCRAVRLDTGVADWQLVAVPSGPVAPPRAASLVAPPLPKEWGSLPGAGWISSSPDDGKASGTKGPYTYELRFNLSPCFHNAGVSLALLVDDSATVFLNGNKIGERLGLNAFKGDPTLIESTKQDWFNGGPNTLRVVVNNEQGPTGFLLSGIVDAEGGLCC